MNRVARELRSVSQNLKEYVRFKIQDVGPKQADFVNNVCAEIDDLADRIRRNEDLTLAVERKSVGDDTEVTVSMSDHEAARAIREEIVQKLSNLGKKRKLDIVVREASRRSRP